MLKRGVTGAFIAAMMGAVLYFSYIPVVLTCFCVILSVFAVYEISRASGWLGNEVFFAAALLLAVVLSLWEMPFYLRVLQVVYMIACVGLALMMLRQKRCSLTDPVKAFVLCLTVVFLFKAFPVLRAMENGLYYLGGAMILCAVTDIGAYLVGSSMGRHKLIPSVSPNKTVEGSVGGIVFAVLVMLLTGAGMEHSGLIRIDYPGAVVYCVLASVIGQFGDLCMSGVKRVCGVKDLGDILPGHGGMLDRFDSMMLVIPFTVLYLHATDGFIL